MRAIFPMRSESSGRNFVPQVLTANSLREGHVVFLDALAGWSSCLRDALVARDEAAVQSLTIVLESGASAVVEPYLMAVLRQADGSWRPAAMRERRRVQGPSIGSEKSAVCWPGRAA